MKTKSKLYKIAMCLAFGLILLSSSYAQTKFEVTTPSGIAGTYDMAAAGFGGELPGCINLSPITGELIIVDDGTDPASDGCETIQNDLTGKIALIDRGACEFGVKCLNAENAGAIMVVVCNNQPTDIFAMGAGAVGDQVTIPALMISQSDCATIRAEIPSVTVNVFWDPIIPSDDVVLWDGGQFDGGFGDWTTVAISPDTAVWTWTSDGRSDNGNIVHSPTVCNGAAIFDANVYNAAASGTPAPYPQFSGELISPIIDCSTFDLVSLKFYTHNLRLNGNTTYSTSIDSGMTWSNPVTIETENVFTATETSLVGTEIHRYLVSEFAGEENCQIKFTFDGDFYFFILDDVQLIEPERNNLAVMENFYAIAPNVWTPSSQVEPFSFLADVGNLGAVEQPNTNLEVFIIDDSNSQTVHNEILPYGNVPPDTIVENIPFPGFFTPDGSITTYSGSYEVSSDSTDFDPSNNIQTFDFATTDLVFAKEDGATGSIRPADSNWDDGEAHSWAFGNYYYVVNGDDFHASSVTFSIATPDPSIVGRLLEIALYRWDEDANSVADNNMDPDERTKIGTALYEISGEESFDSLITIPLNIPPNTPGPVDINSGDHLVAMVEYRTNDQNDLFISTNSTRDYNAMVFRSEEVEGVADPNSRYACMLGINEPLEDEPYSSVGFGRDVIPVVRLNLEMVDNVENILDEANIVEVLPNPADQKINLSFELVENQQNIEVRIYDLNGRLLLDQPYENMQNGMLEYDVSQYASGTYFLQFVTDQGVRTKRFIVQH